MKRRVWKWLVLVALLPVLLLAGLQWWVVSRFTPEEIVTRLERTWNCRATVGSVSVRMFGFPARLEVRNVNIVPADESGRPARPGETFVRVGHMLLEMNLWSLATGELEVRRALIDGVAMLVASEARHGPRSATLTVGRDLLTTEALFAHADGSFWRRHFTVRFTPTGGDIILWVFDAAGTRARTWRGAAVKRS